MKLLSWNIQTSTVTSRADIVDALLKEDADILCLQEVTSGLESKVKKEYRVRRFLEQELGVIYRFRFFSPNYESYPYTEGKIKHDYGGLIQCGVMTFSKYKTIRAVQHFYCGDYEQIRDHSSQNVQPSSMQIQTFETPLGDVQVLHFREIQSGNEALMYLTDYLQTHNQDRIIVTGFFSSETAQKLKDKFHNSNIHEESNHTSNKNYIFSNNIAVHSLKSIHTDETCIASIIEF